jgi:hypothetical protein
MADQTYAERLNTKLAPLADMSNPDWVRYVKDHRSVILQQTVKVTIAPEIMFTFRYRMRALLTELGYNADLAGITMWLNNLKTNADVLDLGNLRIPNYEAVKELYNQFTSFMKKLES